uniref:Uncharacterized protein n=1 Tax=Eutreptiella gymnastica TaxID=73025 RepID=A0A7S1IGC5_9EUGL|mmetsp:Transcript_16602/g.29640  ORF Transcript_16602/g.29640 Transcript_16602/m.29640 type:complete len:178 (+) Transcript_16602:269-802(+)
MAHYTVLLPHDDPVLQQERPDIVWHVLGGGKHSTHQQSNILGVPTTGTFKTLPGYLFSVCTLAVHVHEQTATRKRRTRAELLHTIPLKSRSPSMHPEQDKQNFEHLAFVAEGVGWRFKGRLQHQNKTNVLTGVQSCTIEPIYTIQKGNRSSVRQPKTKGVPVPAKMNGTATQSCNRL